jgi:WS/DGAT/MGAT family acyltransferase
MSVHYEPLSHLDNSFLALESRATHMHVGSVTVFDAGPLLVPDGGIDIARVKRYIASTLHRNPRYRQRLAWVPVEGRAVWVDDDHFNIDYHVRHVALPRPGTERQLKNLAGRLMSQQLDRSKPLWEMNVVEGLEGDRFALITKIHHAMIDGVAGVDLMAALLRFDINQEIEEAPEFEPRPVPNGTELFVRETSRIITERLAAIGNVRGWFGDVTGTAADVAHRARAVGASLSSGWLIPTGRTPINGDVGPNRRFDWLALPLDDVKAIKNALGGTVNDVILATVAGGVRRYLLEEHGMAEDDVAALSYRVMAPVSVRSETQQGQMGNQVAMWLVSLPVGEPDPATRILMVNEETGKLKATDQALGASTLVRFSTGAPVTLVSLGARLASNARPFNMTVTNVPGPQFPMYMLGAKLLATYPLVPLWESHGVGLAMFSYNGEVCWGFNADYDLLEDLPAFVAAMADAFTEMQKAAENPPAEPPDTNQRSAKKRPPLGTR